jgi:hypothetical protein
MSADILNKCGLPLDTILQFIHPNVEVIVFTS